MQCVNYNKIFIEKYEYFMLAFWSPEILSSVPFLVPYHYTLSYWKWEIQHQRFCCSCRFAKTIGMSVPMKATFFITYIMVDGWAGIAAEILRLVPLVIFHLKNTFLVKTEQDREQAMDPGFLSFATSEPRIQLYILLGLVYSVITPVLLPFIIVFFAFSFLIFRHQVHQDIGLAIIFKCFNTCINASDKS